ncbi:MAG TPA: 4'-phosphopantetheinyl transferase superfamily protein [Anaerovoracaceae bacterium]|nr:4'-phosphopantetheinyl transferase superfamily protein [Anaerovoracaceae bacterium]
MNIYLYNVGDVTDAEKTLRRTCTRYLRDKGIQCSDLLKETIMSRTPLGKPYFEGIDDLHFSISHSGGIWACAVDSTHVGFDIEDCLRKIRSPISLAERFYTKDEKDYVSENGLEGFLQIWVRKEAYLKYRGTGLSGGLASLQLVHNGTLIRDFPDCRIEGVDIDSGIIAAYCIVREKQINIIDCR